MFGLIKWLLLILVMALLLSPFFLLEDEQRVLGASSEIDANQIDQAKAFLSRNDPRRLQPGEFVTQWIDEQELSLAANYLLSQLASGGVAFELHPGYAYGQVSVELPDNPAGRFMNATVILSQSSSMLTIESLSVGGVTVPRFVAEPVRQFVHEQLLGLEDYRAAIESLNGLQLMEDRMLVMYQWNPSLYGRLKDAGRDMLVDDAMRERLLAYTSQIRNVAPALPREISLSELMGPVFILAEARGGDPVEENRAALLALSFYFSGVDVARMLGVNLEGGGSLGKKLTLYGRYDFAQHFLTSAALTLMSTSSGFADSVGLFKELDDAGGGSGFSFTDIGADRAGVRVAEIAIRDRAGARYIQTFFAGRPAEEAFMPYFLDLPELMENRDFERRFGGTSDPRYQQVIDDIESRLDETPVFANAPR